MNLTEIFTNSNPILIDIFAVLLSAIEGLFFFIFLSIVFKLKSTKKEKYIFIGIIAISGGISSILPNSIFKDTINILAFLLSMKFIFNLNVKNSFIALVCSYIGIFVCEYISESVLILVLHYTLDDITKIPSYYLLGMLLTYIFFALEILIIKSVKEKRFFPIVDMPLKTSIILNLVLGIFTLLLEAYMLSIYTDAIPFKLTLLIIITLLIYFSISMYSIIRTNTLEKTKADLENEILYNKTLSLLHDNIRGFKHDFNNIVQAIGGYVALNDMDGLRDYYKNLLNDCKLTNNLDLLNPETINNPSIYSLLTNKYFIASSKNIKMTFSIFTDLSNINFNMYELSRILGILLDNAIEAAEETEEKFVDIEFVSDNKKQLFIIRNSCKDSNISTTKIFEKGYSTKERNSGIGLWKVHKILSKNTNLDLFTTVENNIFSQQLEIFY